MNHSKRKIAPSNNRLNSQKKNDYLSVFMDYNKIFYFWVILTAATPIVSRFFRSYIGSGGPDNQKFYGYTPDLYMTSWLQCVTAVMLVWLAIVSLQKKKIYLNHHPLFLTMIALIAWAGLSFLWSLNHYESYDKISHWLAALGGAWIFIQLIHRTEQIIIILQWLLIAGVFTAALGCAQYLWQVSWVNQAVSPAATFGNKNFAAQFCIIMIPFAWLLYLLENNAVKKWLYILSICIIYVFLIYTQTRAAWIAATVQIVALLLWVVYERKHHRPHKMKVTQLYQLGFAILLFVTAIHFNSNGFNKNAMQDIASTSSSIAQQANINHGNVRWPMWFNSSHLIREHFLMGVGIGNWYIQYPLYQQTILKDPLLTNTVATRHAHNDILQFTAELGVIGLILILISGYWVLLIGVRMLSAPDRVARTLAVLTVISILGLIIDSLFSSPLQRPMPAWLLFFMFSILIYLDQHNNMPTQINHLTSNQQPISIQPIASVPILLMSFVIAIAAFNINYKWLTANAHYWKAKTANSQRDFQSVLLFGSLAYQWNPARKRLLNFVGGAQLLLTNYDQAILALEQVREHYPYMKHTLSNLSTAYRKKKMYSKSIEILSILQKIQPHHSAHSYNLGVLYNSLNQKQQAIKWFSLALSQTDLSSLHKQKIYNYFDQINYPAPNIQ